MVRRYSTTTNGLAFSERIKIDVWQKALPLQGRDPADYRLDNCGALIQWDQYGLITDNGTGWEIDHILPIAHGGTDRLDNLQPLQWQHNRKKGDSLGQSYCFLSKK